MEQDKDPVERTNLKCKSSPLFFYLLAAFIFWFLFHSSSNLFCTIVFTNLIHLYSEEDCWLTAVDLWSCDYLLWPFSRFFSLSSDFSSLTMLCYTQFSLYLFCLGFTNLFESVNLSLIKFEKLAANISSITFVLHSSSFLFLNF